MIFVTVGTGAFDELIVAADELPFSEVFYQIGLGRHIPKGEFARMLSQERFNRMLIESSLVITHAGAGNIFNLLEMQKRFVAVPNLFRTDQHQMDICKFIESNQFGFVCWDLTCLSSVIARSSRDYIRPYTKTAFYGFSEILEM